MRRKKAARARGALEAEVLMCLASASGPMTPAQVQVHFGGELAYTTVMTTLSRLHTKGALSRVMVGRAYAYELIGDPERARSNMTAHQMLKLLDEHDDRAGALASFVAELTPADEEVLTSLLGRPSAGTAAGRHEPVPGDPRRRGGAANQVPDDARSTEPGRNSRGSGRSGGREDSS